jgi:O-methyltransferase domain
MEKKICSIIPLLSSGVPAAEISEKVGIPENRLTQILRQLTGIGIFRESSPRAFAHTSTSAFLEANTSIWQDLLLHATDESFKAAGYLPESLDLYADQFDKVQKADLRTAFNLAFKTEAHLFDWLYFPENVNHYGQQFGRAMMGTSRAILGNLLDCYDWTKFEEGDKIVDVGGGVGHVGVLVKKKVKPGVQVIVQDLPSVVEQGQAIPEHRDVIQFQAYDFFTEQPVVGAKLYYLRMIAHDWPDKACQTILGHVVNAMNVESKVLIFDSVWPEGEYWASGKDDKSIIEAYSWERRFNSFRDMQMLNLLGLFLASSWVG